MASATLVAVMRRDVKTQGDNCMILEGVAKETDFYIVRSYDFVPKEACDVLAKANYGGGSVTAAVRLRMCGARNFVRRREQMQT